MDFDQMDIQIDELVLDGFSSVQTESVAEVFKQELSHLIARQGLGEGLLQSRNISVLDGGAFDLRANDSSQAIGQQVARLLMTKINGSG